MFLLAQSCDAICKSNVAADTLQPAMDAGLLKYRIPAGSLYLWCKVLMPFDMERLYEVLESQGLSVAPGIAFNPESGQKSSLHFRVCFTATTREMVAEGLSVLCRTLQAFAESYAGAIGGLSGSELGIGR